MPAVDEQQRVLAELEILLLAIRAAREEREPLGPDFVAPGSSPRTVGTTADVTRIGTARRSGGAAAHDEGVFTHAPLTDSPAPDAVSLAAGASNESAPGGQVPHTPVARSAGIAALLGVGALLLVWAFNPWDSADRPAAPPRTPQVASAGPPPTPPPAAVRPSDPQKVRIDLATLRRVWLRVTVDGRIVMEREAEAGERVPFEGERSIVVRAGDAGAVLVRVGDGEQSALGRDGQVLTRAFPASAP